MGLSFLVSKICRRYAFRVSRIFLIIVHSGERLTFYEQNGQSSIRLNNSSYTFIDLLKREENN